MFLYTNLCEVLTLKRTNSFSKIPRIACATTTQAISDGGATGSFPCRTKKLSKAKTAGPARRPPCRAHWVRTSGDWEAEQKERAG